MFDICASGAMKKLWLRDIVFSFSSTEGIPKTGRSPRYRNAFQPLQFPSKRIHHPDIIGKKTLAFQKHAIFYDLPQIDPILFNLLVISSNFSKFVLLTLAS